MPSLLRRIVMPTLNTSSARSLLVAEKKMTMSINSLMASKG